MTSFKFSKVVMPMFTVATALTTLMGCLQGRTGETDAEVAWAVSGSSSAEIEKALRAKVAFRVNLKTNRATLYKDGVAVDQWNIASADVTGEWHNGQPQYTPTGVFNVEDLQMCPAWYPRKPVNPATGRVVASEQERQQVFKQNPHIYGACGSRNPLGKYVLWFNGAYGMHGNSAEEILEFANPNDRRVSGGCIRNPNAKIRTVFHSVLGSFSELDSYAAQVNALESRAVNDRWTITRGVSSLNMRVVVGNWSADPAIGSRIGQLVAVTPAPLATARPEVTAQPQPVVSATPKPNPTPVPTPVATTQPSTPSSDNPLELSGRKSCYISAVDSSTGVAPVYLNVPGSTGETRVSSFYRLEWPVTVFGKVEGTPFFKVSRGYLHERYVSRCSL